MIRRLAGLLAFLGTALGAVLIVLALQDRHFAGYVSEAGVPDHPGAASYRVGVLAIAAALLLLALAVAGQARVAALLFVVAGLATFVSGSVACSAGCPLPPYERTTAADLVHAGAGIIGVGVFALALAALAFWGNDRAVRWFAGIGAAVILPLGVTIAVFMLAVGRGTGTAMLERTILSVAVVVALAVAVRQTLRPAARGT